MTSDGQHSWFYSRHQLLHLCKQNVQSYFRPCDPRGTDKNSHNLFLWNIKCSKFYIGI